MSKPVRGRRLLIFTAQLMTTLVLAELGIRALNPRPRIQILRHDRGLDIEMQHGVPVWTQPGGDHTREGKRATGLRLNRDCVNDEPDRTVLLIGDSITYGAGLQWNETVGSHLQELVDARWPDERICVTNMAQPGLVFVSQLAQAKDLIPALQPDIVFWQLFYGAPNHPTMIGDAVYVLQGPEGQRDPPRLLPDPLHGVLFRWSHLYQYTSLSLLPGDGAPDWKSMIKNDLPEAVALVNSQGAEVTFVLAPKLDRPFADHDTRPYPTYEAFTAWASDTDHNVIRLADALREHDVVELRRNTCCHYNPIGHRAYAEVLLDELAQHW